ncbi:MAG: orotidine-5'-phosphate decarboxylase [Deltaproteobacteria bacterium]|nr:orotidine-5'-phosphate decarboxylase [Deltaproteobacteria bacterium]
MNFIEKLELAQHKNNSLLCVGLDPVLERIPDLCRQSAEPFFAFNRALIDATADLVCAYKPQIAHYAACGVEAELLSTISYVRENYPHIPVILDAKRGDIGSTAEKYALEAFERYQADAVTVNPYLGGDSLEPFLNYAEKGVVILCRTSNPGGGDLQGLEIDGEALYLKLARLAATSWNKNQNILLVVGATWPDELAKVRKIVGEIPLLVPGIGAQGGDLEAVLKAGLDGEGRGLVINSSRGIIYASSGDDFAAAARRASLELRDAINVCRKSQTV